MKPFSIESAYSIGELCKKGYIQYNNGWKELNVCCTNIGFWTNRNYLHVSRFRLKQSSTKEWLAFQYQYLTEWKPSLPFPSNLVPSLFFFFWVWTRFIFPIFTFLMIDHYFSFFIIYLIDFRGYFAGPILNKQDLI